MLVDYFDEKSEISAMARTTGFSASIIAQYLGEGKLTKGALPLELRIPAERFIADLAQRGIVIKERVI